MKTCSLLLLIASCSLAGNKPMKFLDVLEFRTVADGTLSKDGKHFAYTISSLDWKQGKRFTEIWLTDTATGNTRQITFTPDKDESEPAFSPDGQWLAFLSNRDASAPSPDATAIAGRRGGSGNQVYLLRVSGGEAQKISEIPGGVASFRFSADGKWIGFLAGRNESRQLYLFDTSKAASPGAKPEIVARHGTGVSEWAWSPDSTRIYFTSPDELDALEQRRIDQKFDVRLVDAPAPRRHLWEIPLDSKLEKRLTSGSEYTISRFDVSADGRWVGFTGGSPNRYTGRLDSVDGEAYLLSVATGNSERLTNNKVDESTPKISPDGKWLALTAPDEYTYFRRGRVYVRPTNGGEWKKLPQPESDHDVGATTWSADSKRLYFNEGVGTSEHVFSIEAPSGKIAQITDRPGSVVARYDEDTNQFVLTAEDSTHPRDYWITSPADAAQPTRWRRMSNANPHVSDFALGTMETVRWKSSDGQMVEGLLVKPVGYEPGKRYPLIVQLHGGPAGAVTQRFSGGYSYYVHVFAAGGYALFQPNYRGSINYGEKFRTAIVKDYFRQAFDDIMTGVDDMIRRGIADPDKLGMMGWSAGGHWSNWTLTHTDRFKAISSGAGAVNWISMYAQTDVQKNREHYFGGRPYDNWDHYVEVSPIRYIKNAKTPTLIHVGHDDQRVPRPQSEELHMALKKLGVPTEFIVYPRMGHGLTEPRYQLVKMVSEYNWFEKWIRGREKWLDWKELLDTLPKDELRRGDN